MRRRMHRCCGRRRCSDGALRAAHGWAGQALRRFGAARPSNARASDRSSFRLAMLGHAGAVGIELLVTPEVLRITRRPDAALVQGLRPLRADPDAAALGIVRRCQRADGNNDGERGQTFLKFIMTSLLQIIALSRETCRRRGRTRLLRLAVERSPLRLNCKCR
jgi:hypothetical protein